MSAARKIPQRQCVGCREMKNKKDLIRVIKTADDTYEIDATGKKNGRGAYICPTSQCLNKAIASKGLERSFKAVIPETVYEQLKKELEIIEAR